MMDGSSTMNQSAQMAHAAMDSSAMGAMDHGQMADAKAPVKLVSGRFHTTPTRPRAWPRSIGSMMAGASCG